jgi:hypothetical protein
MPSKTQLTTPEYRVFFPIKVAKSKISGKGAYAVGRIPARKKIGDLGGVIITLREARKIVAQTKGVVNMVEFDEGNIALNASVNPNDMRFINHSCDPNTYMRLSNRRVEFYALHNIKPGEELSCDYGETHHEGKLPCQCGAKNCKGFI